MSTERTFAIIKPDAVKARLAGRILARIEEAGFTVRAMRLTHLSKREAEGFYAVHKARPFFGSLPVRSGRSSALRSSSTRRTAPTRPRRRRSSSATSSGEWNCSHLPLFIDHLSSHLFVAIGD
jgi:nucleoside-diphosphate kinase